MKTIIEAIANNPALLARYKALEKGDLEGFAQLAREAGFELTAEQLAELQNADGELSEADLRQVAAGFYIPPLCGARGFHK